MNFFKHLGIAASLRSLRNQVNNAYIQYPKIVNSCTGFLTFASGDLLAQKLGQQIVQKGSNDDSISLDSRIDIIRSFKVGLLGVAMNGICLHYWYRILDRFIGNSMKSKLGILLKVLADQLVYAPLSILAFFSFAAAQEKGEVSDIIDALIAKVKFNFLHTLAADCAMWPLVNAINFRFIPLNYRPSFVGLAQLVWQTYLSTAARLKNEQVTSHHHPQSSTELSIIENCVARQE